MPRDLERQFRRALEVSRLQTCRVPIGRWGLSKSCCDVSGAIRDRGQTAQDSKGEEKATMGSFSASSGCASDPAAPVARLYRYLIRRAQEHEAACTPRLPYADASETSARSKS